MSAVYGVNRTLGRASLPESKIAPGKNQGKQVVFYDEYEASALTAASTISCFGGVLPAGLVVNAVYLMTDALGTGTTVAVGDSETAARYMAAVTCTSAVSKGPETMVIDGMGYVIGTVSGDDEFLLTTAANSATGTIKVLLVGSL